MTSAREGGAGNLANSTQQGGTEDESGPLKPRHGCYASVLDDSICVWVQALSVQGVPTTDTMRHFSLSMKAAASRGMPAPTQNATAEAAAAWYGFVMSSRSMPSCAGKPHQLVLGLSAASKRPFDHVWSH